MSRPWCPVWLEPRFPSSLNCPKSLKKQLFLFFYPGGKTTELFVFQRRVGPPVPIHRRRPVCPPTRLQPPMPDGCGCPFGYPRPIINHINYLAVGHAYPSGAHACPTGAGAQPHLLPSGPTTRCAARMTTQQPLTTWTFSISRSSISKRNCKCF